MILISHYDRANVICKVILPDQSSSHNVTPFLRCAILAVGERRQKGRNRCLTGGCDGTEVIQIRPHHSDVQFGRFNYLSQPVLQKDGDTEFQWVWLIYQSVIEVANYFF